MSLVRAFIAIELPPDVLSQVGRLQARVRQDVPSGLVRWARPEGIHLTLKFLGDVEHTRLPEIEGALRGACALHAPFEVTLSGLGCFPNPHRPRVIWLGVSESDDRRGALHALQAGVERAIAPLGYPTERRSFHPHLTLGRVKSGRGSGRRGARQAPELDALGQYVSRAKVQVGQISVDAVHLVRSELLPAGAVYTDLAACPLLAGAPQAAHG